MQLLLLPLVVLYILIIGQNWAIYAAAIMIAAIVKDMRTTRTTTPHTTPATPHARKQTSRSASAQHITH